MRWLADIPAWLGAAIIGAVIAALGHLAKIADAWWAARRLASASRLAQLQQLTALLHTSKRLFAVQNRQARILARMLAENHPGPFEDVGFERLFVTLYESFTPEEKDLHGVVRSITVNAMKPTNQLMSDWLKQDRFFKTGSLRIRKRREFADRLHELEVHLALWHAKYEYWIPANPKHALVYLADEEEHGVEFPQGIDALVDEVRTGLR